MEAHIECIPRGRQLRQCREERGQPRHQQTSCRSIRRRRGRGHWRRSRRGRTCHRRVHSHSRRGSHSQDRRRRGGHSRNIRSKHRHQPQPGRLQRGQLRQPRQNIIRRNISKITVLLIHYEALKGNLISQLIEANLQGICSFCEDDTALIWGSN